MISKKFLPTLCLCTMLSTAGCGLLNETKPTHDSQQTYNQAQHDAQGYAKTLEQMSGPMGLSEHAFLTREVQESIHQLAKLHNRLSDIERDLMAVASPLEQIAQMKQDIDALGARFDMIQKHLYEAAPASEVPTPLSEGKTSAETMAHKTVNNVMSAEETKRPMSVLDANSAGQKFVPPAVKAKPKTTPKKPAVNADVKKEMAPAPNADGLIGIRVGEHKGKTRLVLDMSKAITIEYDLDTSENILVVELPGQSASDTIKSKSFPRSSLLKSYDIQKSGDNTLVIFMFKKPTRIMETMRLGSKGKNTHRVVFDMAK